MSYQVTCAKCGTVGYREDKSEARKMAVRHEHDGYSLMVHDTQARYGDVDLWDVVGGKLIPARRLGLVYGDHILLDRGRPVSPRMTATGLVPSLAGEGHEKP
jgi:hypothetical protein